MAKRSSIMLCLIRCGEPTWSVEGRVHGVTDLPMSDQGRTAIAAQLHRLANVKAASVHHPPDEAATDTATMCAKVMGAKVRSVAEFADPDLGLLEGLTEQEFAERFRSRHKQWEDDPMALAPPEGEEMAHAADRIFRAVAKVLRRSRGEEVAIVLHPMGLAMLRAWLADRPLTAMREMMAPEPYIERYALPLEMVDDLEAAGVAVGKSS